MSIELRFRAGLGPQPGGAVALRFGFIGDPPVVPPGTSLRALVATGWRGAAAATAATATGWRQAQPVASAWGSTWARYQPIGRWWGASWGAAAGLALLRRSTWSGTAGLQAAIAAPWASAQVLRGAVGSTWGAADPVAGRLASAWRDTSKVHQAVVAPWGSGHAVAVRSTSAYGRSLLQAVPVRALWRAGVPLVSYGGPWAAASTGPVAPTPCYRPPNGGAVALRLARLLAPGTFTQLRFSCGNRTTVRVPIRRVYMVTNTTTLVRVDTGDSIPLDGALSLQLDADSRDLGFSASIKEDALSLVEPSTPGALVELLATVNGIPVRLIAESISRDRRFERTTLRIQGRGRAAALDAPYAALASFGNPGAALTSQQLLDAALPSGWSAAWGLTAWLVPAGIWSHQGTPASAATQIATAGGGYLQPHLTDKVLRVLARYPNAPWDWAGITPDLELPAAVTEWEGIEWAEKPRYNGVHIGSTTGAARYLVKRTGTAADVLAQMVIDPLMTHVDAGRQRGLPILAEGGRQARVSLRLPVLSETGIILPGTFVSYVDGSTTRRGLVRSVSLQAGFPETFQTIGVETHVN